MSEASEALEELRRILGGRPYAYQDDGQPWVCREVTAETVLDHLKGFHGASAGPAPTESAMVEMHARIHGTYAPAQLRVAHGHKPGTERGKR